MNDSNRIPTLTPDEAMAKAVQFFEVGKLQECEQVCRKILEAQPNFPHAYFQLGLIAVQAGKMSLASDLMAKAVQLNPKNHVYHKAIGEVNRRLGRFDVAIAAATQAAVLAPKDPEIRYNLGLALADAGRGKDAEAQYRLALEYNPSYGLAANNLGTVMEHMGNVEEAEKFYHRATVLNPRHAEAQNNLGALQSARGDLDDAITSFSAAIAASPAFVHPHYNLSSLKKYDENDPHLKMLEAIAARAEQLPPETRLRYWFAVGKAREDIGKYDEAFYAYEQGNKLKRLTFMYDSSRISASIDDIIAKYTKDFAKKKQGATCDNKTPIFIVGMPRSGTTLIEQILASHSKVYGAGELRELSDVVLEKWPGLPEGGYIEALVQESDAGLKQMGEEYIAKIRKLNASKEYITDKMPGNFFYVGLIHKILPNAKIIHAMRDPMDVCISNYSRLFNETMPFAYDMDELVQYHKGNLRLMNHWKSVLAKSTILDVQYEDVVADLEGQAKRMLDFCDLELEPACLEFHKNKRLVNTASVAQVRKPIYKTSVARWERFKKHVEQWQQKFEGDKK